MQEVQMEDDREHQDRTIGSTRRQYVAAILASLLGVCLGTEIGWTSPMMPLLTSPNPPVGSTPLSLDDIAWLPSISCIGSMTGCLFWGYLTDGLGRKRTAYLAALPHLLSWIIILFANSFVWLMVGRFVVGVGNGGALMTSSVFITEIAQDDLRGFFGSFLKISYGAGLLYAYVVGTYLGYRGMAVCCLVIPVIFLLTFIWLPETPLFYWKNGQLDKAEKSLLWYRCGDVYATEKTLLTYKSLPNKKTQQSLKSLVSTRGRTKALLMGVALAVAFQTTGIGTITTFAVSIFQLSGTSFSSYQSAIILAAIKLVCSMVCSVVVERCGRTFLIATSLASISLSLITLGTYLFLFQNVPHHPLDFVPLTCLCVFMGAFSLGFGPVTMVYQSEIFPPEIRGKALSILVITMDVSTLAFIQLYPTILRCWNMYGVFWFYGVTSLFFAIMVTSLFIETKGRAQNVIVKIFNNEELTAEEIEIEASLKKKRKHYLIRFTQNTTEVA